MTSPPNSQDPGWREADRPPRHQTRRLDDKKTAWCPWRAQHPDQQQLDGRADFGDHRGGVLVLNCKEYGRPPVAAPTRRGFGSRLMAMSLSSSGGNTTTFEPDGLAWMTTAPLNAIQE